MVQGGPGWSRALVQTSPAVQASSCCSSSPTTSCSPPRSGCSVPCGSTRGSPARSTNRHPACRPSEPRSTACPLPCGVILYPPPSADAHQAPSIPEAPSPHSLHALSQGGSAQATSCVPGSGLQKKRHLSWRSWHGAAPDTAGPAGRPWPRGRLCQMRGQEVEWGSTGPAQVAKSFLTAHSRRPCPGTGLGAQ